MERMLAQLSCAPIRALEVVSCGLQAVVSLALARTLRNILIYICMSLRLAV